MFDRKEYMKKWRKDNPEYHAEYYEKWKQNNPNHSNLH
jgi:hypothetical protein